MAAPAAWWSDHPQVYAGRDLEGGGTWLGITRDGRFAAITNVRAPGDRRDDAPSRGRLVANYLTSTLSPQEYIREIGARAHVYNGFNLLVGDAAQQRVAEAERIPRSQHVGADQLIHRRTRRGDVDLRQGGSDVQRHLVLEHRNRLGQHPRR